MQSMSACEILAERSRLCLLNELSELCLLQKVAYEIGDLLYRRQPKSIGIAELVVKPARRRLLLAHKYKVGRGLHSLGQFAIGLQLLRAT